MHHRSWFRDHIKLLVPTASHGLIIMPLVMTDASLRFPHSINHLMSSCNKSCLLTLSNPLIRKAHLYHQFVSVLFQPGDVIESEIEGIGKLKNTIVWEAGGITMFRTQQICQCSTYWISWYNPVHDNTDLQQLHLVYHDSDDISYLWVCIIHVLLQLDFIFL